MMTFAEKIKAMRDAETVSAPLRMLLMRISPEAQVEALGPLLVGAIMMHKLPYDERVTKLVEFSADAMATLKQSAEMLEKHS